MHCASRAFSMCKAGMVTRSQVCKAWWELRTAIPWGTLSSVYTAVVQGSRSRHTKKKKSQCWELVPTLCTLQGLTISSPMDWTPFSSWNMLDVFLKHILQLGFIWKKSSLRTPKALCDVNPGTVHGNKKEIHFQSTLVVRTQKCRCTSWKLEKIKIILKDPEKKNGCSALLLCY